MVKFLPPFPVLPSPLNLPCLHVAKLFGVLLLVGRNVQAEGKAVWVLSSEF